MSRFRDRLLPAGAGAAVLAVAAVVLLLLGQAGDRGTRALEAAKIAQVRATASSFNARVVGGLSAIAGLGARPWELTSGSVADQKELNTFAVDPNALSGIYLIDERDRVTSGILLRPGRLGSTLDLPGWNAAKALLPSRAAAVLPVTSRGFTTELPSYAFVVAIRGDTPNSVRGALVFEQTVTPQSAFQLEIAQLADRRSVSAAWFFVDDAGNVLATTAATGLGDPVDDPRYLTIPAGLSHLGPRIVVTGDVPSVGWRVVFRQNSSEFVKPLSGPLQSAGLILVLLLLGIGLAVVILLVRRLAQAKEEQRRLRELSRSQEEFISIVSHELRTPVAGVLGFLQTSLDHWETMDDDDRLLAVRRAVANARRLQAMTRDVLDTESIESGMFGYARQRIDLADELRAAGLDWEAPGDGAGIDVRVPGTPVTVDADPDRIQQVLGNLIENARKNAPPGDPITVELASTDRVARISVVDRGPGIAPESLERIFDKFVRGRDDSVSGTGLGLYIVRRIVEAHGGRVWAESTPGTRTAFVVELPLADAPAPLPVPTA